MAIARDKTDLARLLIERGADIEAKTGLGVTPLCMALQANNQEVISFKFSI